MNTESNNTATQHNNSTRHLVYCAAACLIAIGIGGLFTPGEWYTQINIAPWSPPNLAFPIVWSILYVCIALSGWRIFNQGTFQLKALWTLQLALNALWSWVFFGQHWVLLGFIDIVLIMTLVTYLIITCWNIDTSSKGEKPNLRVCSYLLAPYLLWLSIACSLNLYILLNN